MARTEDELEVIYESKNVLVSKNQREEIFIEDSRSNVIVRVISCSQPGGVPQITIRPRNP